MALASTTVWEVKTTGHIKNGGGFNASQTSAGTDKSLTAHTAYTDITTASNTTITSAGNPFSSADIGNIINIESGTGLTPGFYEITSVAAVVATLDRAIGTHPAGGDGAGRLGGAFALPSNGDTVYVPGNIVYIEEGTYTLTATETMTCDGSATGGSVVFAGYPSGGSRTVTEIAAADKPVFTRDNNTASLFTFNGHLLNLWYNIKCTYTGASRGNGWTGVTATSIGGFVNCECDGTAYGWDCGTNAATSLMYTFVGCVARNCTVDGWRMNQPASGHIVSLDNCLAEDCTGNGVTIGTGFVQVLINRCVFDHNAIGVRYTGTTANAGVYITGSVFYNNTADGIQIDQTSGAIARLSLLKNNIFYGNAAYGIDVTTSGVASGNNSFLMLNNAFGANGTAATRNCWAGTATVTLSADPFTAKASGDFSLNNVSGGGAACRSAGRPAKIAGNVDGLTTSAANIGASDPQAGTAINFTDFGENMVLDAIFRAGTVTTPLFAALSTTTPTDAGGNITEPSGNGYARVSFASNSTNWAAASGGSNSNATAITFPTASGSWGTVTYLVFFDASSSGNAVAYVALTASSAVGNTDTPQFAIGALTFAMG